MITFTATVRVIKEQTRDCVKKTGESFTIHEFVLEGVDKKQTQLVARVMDDVTVAVGGLYECQIGIASNTTRDGRIFSNFVVLDALEKEAPKTAAPSKTNAEAMDEAFDEIPF